MTLDRKAGQETQAAEIPPFIELSVRDTTSPWCVDGRPDYSTVLKGPQMLGGSLHPLVLKAIWEDMTFDENFVTSNFQTLKDAGFDLGVHWGAHKHEGVSDCGFADRLPDVIREAQEKIEEIKRRLLLVYQENQDAFCGLTKEGFENLLNTAFEKINAYDPDQLIQLKGEGLITKAQNSGAQVINLSGEHQEKVAFVNLKEGVTLATNQLNRERKQAFNLDLWSAVKQAKALGVNEGFAQAASLILYQATEMVLVEDKGKSPLTVVIYK